MDWIEARMKCSLEQAWLTLREQVNKDLARWKELNANPPVPVEATSEESLIIVRKRFPMEDAKIWVRISRTDESIKFRSPSGMGGENEVQLVPILNTEGECRLRQSDGSELDFWQASRLALEHILF